ncbi:dTDP-4-dehydrorhamnose 3,5-epimerase [Desulfovibrio sp.]|uniref:dTDP-4-dehydrorhamnose 3,5-epimerase n=1 Tax=Desulfovibrio sp. TaxID=885 RepID=UPI002A36DB74|nr:dTDP-4-dehydrorhamnose 3,5-epimerase [Desulfovibrio sp.]MDY0260709.1 dTDP-4-dehydrorhamnose 3,5-epimerase [Desulfovibrio sp.]
MEVVKTPLGGVLLIKPKVWGDARGYFVETWQQERYAAAGIDLPFVQDNHSRSAYGILRGLHFQKTRPQGKLVHVSSGSVFDVAVDIRAGSPSFGQWYGVELTQDNQWQLWVPPGLAHGFVVTSEYAHFHYKCTEYYCPQDEGAIRWNDPDLGVVWPVECPVLSQKDTVAPSWREFQAGLGAK